MHTKRGSVLISGTLIVDCWWLLVAIGVMGVRGGNGG